MSDHVEESEVELPKDQLSEESAGQRIKKVVIRTHSSVIFFYPVMLFAAYKSLFPGNMEEGNAGAFLALLFFNMLIVLFDFGTVRSVFIVTLLSLIGVVLWNFELLQVVLVFFQEGADFRMNQSTYVAFTTFFVLMLIGDWIWAHVNRWEFSANQVKHIRFLQNADNSPGRGLAIRFRINDIFEYILGLGAGTVYLRMGRRRIRLENVLRANTKVTEIERFIRSVGHYDDQGDVFDDEDFDDGF